MFQPYELTVRASSGSSIFELDISVPQGTVGARIAGIFGGRSPSYGGDKCNRGNLPAEIVMETWGSCSIKEDSPLGVSVVAMGQTATNNHIGGMKIYNLTKVNEGETLTELPLSQSPFRDNESTNLKVVAMEKLLESEEFEAIKEDPFSKWDIVCDNIFGTNLLYGKCTADQVNAFKSSQSSDCASNFVKAGNPSTAPQVNFDVYCADNCIGEAESFARYNCSDSLLAQVFEIQCYKDTGSFGDHCLLVIYHQDDEKNIFGNIANYCLSSGTCSPNCSAALKTITTDLGCCFESYFNTNVILP